MRYHPYHAQIIHDKKTNKTSESVGEGQVAVWKKLYKTTVLASFVK